jgi:hypothetical protein
MENVIYGITAEFISCILTYPLSTIKTNSQIRKSIVIKSGIDLYRGIGWSILTELTNAVIFYSIYMGNGTNPLKRSIIGSSIGICASYPMNVKRKLAQIGKSGNVRNPYKGLPIALFNGVPGVSINFTLREKLNEHFPQNKYINGLISTAVSIISTHPLDTLSTCIATRTPIKNILSSSLFTGFRERFLEKNLTIGSKMLILSFLSS